MAVGDGEEPPEVGLLLRTPPDRQKVDDLDEELGMTVACAPYVLDELLQARNEPVVSDAQERTTRHVADAGGLEHETARTAAGEPVVPREYLFGDEAVLGGAPRNHRRDPRALLELQRSDSDGTEPP